MSFLWGANGEEVTPEEIEQRKQIAQSLLGQSQQTPATNWAQGAANMLNSFMGGFMQGRAMKAERANDDLSRAIIAGMSGDGAFGGAGTDARDPHVNPYLGSDEVMKLAGAQDQSDPFAGSGTDAANPVTRDTEAPSGVSPIAHALLSPAQPTVGQAAQAGATNLITQEFLGRMRRAESGGDTSATNPNSSATGDFQFTNPTWTALRQQHPKLGLTADGRTDPAQSQVAAKQLATDNLAYMLAHGVQNPTEGQAYLAHFAGAPTATNLVQADPSTPISQIMSPQQVAANPFLRGMTAGQVQDWAAQKMGGAGTPPTQPQQPQASISAPQQPAFASYADTGPSISQLGAILTDPRLNASAKSFASVLLQNKMQQNLLMQQEQLRQSDPLYRAQINSANALTEWRTGKMNAGNGDGLSGEAATLDARARAGGLIRGTPEYQRYMLNGGRGQGAGDVQPTITGDQAQALGYDPMHTWAPQPNGTMKDMGDNLATAQQKRMQKLQSAKANVDDVLASIDRVQSMNNQLGWLGHGATGHYIADINPASDASAFRNEVESLKSKLSYQTLDGLKSSGVSLGALSDGDMRLLSSASGALNPDGDRKTIQSQLDVIRQKVMDGYSNGLTPQDKEMLSRIAASRGGGGAPEPVSAPQSSQANPSVSDMINAAKPIAPGVSYRKGN